MAEDDLFALERQLADLAVVDGDAATVLERLADAVFPGGVARGDPSRIVWPERRQAAGAGDDYPGSHVRNSDARFRSLVEQLPAVVFYAALGSEENEVYVSPQIETLLGFTQEEWLTNPLLWYSQLHPDDHVTVIEAFTKGVQTGQPFRAEVRFYSRSGEEVWILGEARLILDAANRPAYFQGVAFDITITKRAQAMIAAADRAEEQAKVEAAQLRADTISSHNARLRLLNRQLQAAKEEAEAAVHTRTTFLTTMSHELRTPLNSVIVLAGLLADSPLSPTQQDMVRRMRLSSDHLLELINDVLEFSRLRAGQVDLNEGPFDLQAWLDDTLDIVAPRAAEKGLELRLVIADDVPRAVRADHGRVRQVLLNLLGNAVKFTARGFVEVQVRATAVAPGRSEFECTVRDSGIGIKAEDAATLFDEFRQADSGISREFGGTGLGLAICKRLCELLGGRIWVETEAGPGATVSFTWQADVDDTTRQPFASHRYGASGARAEDWPDTVAEAPDVGKNEVGKNEVGKGARRLRVLIAEDNVMNQQVAMLLLAAMGHDADVVGDGDQAIEAVGEAPYDVVLMDVAMPGTDGMQATRAIRGLGSAVRQPYIVALTAHAFPGDADACIAAGMDDYVAKPIDRAQLARALAAGEQSRPPAGPGVRAQAGPRPDFDPSVAQAILAEFGVGPLGRLLAIFGTEATRLVDLACGAVASGDVGAAERAAHSLKSSAANLGAFALQSSCVRLETLARGGSLDGAAGLTTAMTDQLADALGRLYEVAADGREELPPGP